MTYMMCTVTICLPLSIDYLYALTYGGPYVLKEYWAMLMTPAVNIAQQHCLVLDVFTSKLLQIYQIGLDGNERLILHSGKGLGNIQQRLHANVQPLNTPFYLRMFWSRQNGTSHGYIAAVSYIELKQGSCLDVQGRE